MCCLRPVRWTSPDSSATASFRHAARHTVTWCLHAFLLCLWAAGCTPFQDSQSEEKNPLIVDARAKKAAYNYQGAIQSLEKALEGNPRLSLAHWELGLIFCQNVNDPAAAIYHFEKLLRLRPDWRQADTARQLINVGKIELAKNVPLGPQTPAVQQQIDRLTAKVHELAAEANGLRQQNQALAMQLQQYAVENTQLRERLRTTAIPAPANLPANLAPNTGPLQGVTPTGQPSLTSPPARGPSPIPGTPVGASPSAPSIRASVPLPPAAADPLTPRPIAPRTHAVQPGDTMTRIARRQGVTLRALQAANPDVDPDRLKPGQTLRIPAP